MPDQPDEAARNVGRPRDITRELALLHATAEVLAEVGYDRLTMDAVAARAKSSKATIYRRWPDKTALVIETIRHIEDQVTQWPDTGSFRGDLLAVLTDIAAAVRGDMGRIISGLVSAMPHDRELGRAVRDVVLAPFKEAAQALLRRAQQRGEVPENVESRLVHEIPMAMVLSRFLLTDGIVDDDYVEYVIDKVIIPLMTGPAESTGVRPENR
jgi:AcrR family transcriptional regulator